MSGDLRSDLQSALGSTYTLERELAGGGMSRVFLAEEARLGRKVVVKVLLPELAAGVSADRFEREIRVAAQLAHPSIAPVLTAGEANGLPYYTMPFVQGESLRARLAAEGALQLSDVSGILRDIARALAYAHERGIVHRDIKPENVLLASGAALVTDFGIAKAISASRTEGSESTLTQAGTSIGTPAYMAPEQSMADPTTDSRADIYSFGCLAFELLAGESPFHGRPIHKMLAAHITEQPRGIASLRPECPPALAAFVMRCLEKAPENRPQSALEGLPALEGVTTPSAERIQEIERNRRAGKWNRRALLIPGFLGIAAAALIVALLTKGPADSKTDSSPLQSIAVLPFTNMDGDTANAYFAGGISEELATSLSKVAGLRVVARNSSFRESGRQVDEAEVGKVLNVDALLAGSVRRSGARMRLNARLIGVKDQSILWSDQYDREVKDVFSVQDEITRAIVGAIQSHFASAAKTVVPSGAPSRASLVTSNLDAHDLYLRAQFNLRRRVVPAAVDYFERAIELDSTYARAYSGLSAALEMTPYFVGVPAPRVRGRAIAAAQRALALDPSLAEAHTSLALAYQHAHQWPEAEREHRRAVEVDPGDAAAHVQYARFLLCTGRMRQAYDEAKRAEALDPFSPVIASWVAYTSLMLGKTDEALAAAKRGLELDPNVAPMINVASHVFLMTGQKDTALATIKRLPKVLPWPGFVAYFHAVTGDRTTAMRIARDIEARPDAWSSATGLAWAYLGLNDTTRALDALERATDNNEMWFIWYTFADVIYDPVRGSPRFNALIRRVGLDEKMFTTRSGAPRK